MMRTCVRGGLFVGLLLILLCSGCASSLHKDELTIGGHMPVFQPVDPATDRFPVGNGTIQLKPWNYKAFPQQIVTLEDWDLFFIACFENQVPMISRSWYDMAYYLAQRGDRSALKRLFAYAFQEKLPYFLEKGDKLNPGFVHLRVYEESSEGGLVELNRELYEQAHYPNFWTRFYKGIGLGESDPTLEAYQKMPMQWVPSAPRQRTSPKSTKQLNKLARR